MIFIPRAKKISRQGTYLSVYIIHNNVKTKIYNYGSEGDTIKFSYLSFIIKVINFNMHFYYLIRTEKSKVLKWFLNPNLITTISDSVLCMQKK